MPSGNATSPSSPNSKLNAYVPPKGWEEITADEKIERLREIVHSLSRNLNEEVQNGNWLKNLFFKHSHGEKGEILTQPETYRQSGGGLLGGQMSTSEKPYF